MNRTGSNVLASTINGVTGENNITKVLYDHYYKLLNSNGNTSNHPYVESIMNDIVHSQSIFSLLFSALKMGKRLGTDSVQGEHFKYTHQGYWFVINVV